MSIAGRARAGSPRGRLARAAALLALVGAGACDPNFDDPTIVVDLRVLAIQVEPPEIVIPVAALQDPSALELEDVRVCALIADPSARRGLRFELAACPPTADGRCDEPDEPRLVVAQGAIEDPDETPAGAPACGTLAATPALLEVLRESIEDDPFQGFSSVGVQLELAVTPDDANGSSAYATKRMAYAARLPDARVANRNPALTGIRARRGDGAEQAVALTRCAAAEAAPLAARAGEDIELMPEEPPGAREDYLLPTFDGGARMFTENLTYAWLATAGEWDAGSTGGPTDPFGNVPALDNTWTAPEVEVPTEVALWVVQRDERGGVAWYELCAAVAP